MINRYRLATVLAVLLLFTVGPWDRLLAKKVTFSTVIVTRNYVKSRILAELIQKRTRQPIILLPTGTDDDTIYVLGYKGYQTTKQSKAQFAQMLQKLNPEVVLFLGNERFAPKEYRDKAKKLFPICVLDSPDFTRIAAAASIIMRLKKLERDYLKELKKFERKSRSKTKPEDIWDKSKKKSK